MEGLPICLKVPIRPRPGGRRQIHTHEYHELVYVLEGEGWQVTERARYPVKQGQLYLFPTGVAHAAHCTDGQTQLLFVLYLPELYFASSIWEADLMSAWQRIIAHCQVNSLIDLGDDAELRGNTSRLVDEMQREFGEKRPGYGAAVRVRFSELLLLVMRSPWWQTHIPERPPSPSSRQLVSEAESYVRANWYRELRVDEVLSICNVSRSHFHALFRRYTGRTFVEYVHEVRVDQARNRLAASDRPVGEIATECGFARPAYFSSVFRARTGMTPREYRRTVAGSD